MAARPTGTSEAVLDERDAVRRPFTGEVPVHDSRIHVESGPDGPEPGLAEAFRGQDNGLCGAAVPGVLLLVTGVREGDVGFAVEVHDEAPALDPAWEDVVEVSFRPASDRTRLVQRAGGAEWDLGLPRADHRVRYSARGMDEGRRLVTAGAKEPRADGCLLQFWPAPPGPDRVIRETSRIAAQRHRHARFPAPAGAPGDDAGPGKSPARQTSGRTPAQWTAEERRLHRERWEWGGRLPSARLRGVRESNVLGLRDFDGGLVHALDDVGPEVQRVVAVLAARRACEAARLTGVPEVAAALTALAEGRPLPPPFDDTARMWEALRSEPLPPGPPVRAATPPERPPYRPPAGCEAALVVRPPVPPYVPGYISQPHFALPAVLAAADPDPLKAALDAVWHAVHTYGEHHAELLEEIRRACADPAGG